MLLWFTAPIVAPLCLIAMIVAYAVYHAYAHPPVKLQTVAIVASAGSASGLSPRRWHA
jgi:hypothetical protein